MSVFFGVRKPLAPTPPGPETVFQVYDCTEHTAEFTDISQDGGSSSCVEDFIGEPASRIAVVSGSPTEAGNMISTDTFATSGKYTLDFYWDTETGNWYSDALNNAMNYFFIVKGNDYTVNPNAWAYGRVDSPAWIRLNMRTSSLTLQRQGESNVSYTFDLVSDQWNPLTIEIDWDNETFKVWLHGILRINESIPATTMSAIGSEFQIGWHWHDYNRTENQNYTRIKMELGDRIDEITVPSGNRSMEVSEWGTQDSEGYVSGGILNLDAVTSDANQYVTREWLYKLQGDFDFFIPYNTTHNDLARYVGVLIAPSDEPIENPQNWMSIDRSWSIDVSGWRYRYMVNGSQTNGTQAFTPSTAYQSGWFRFRRFDNNFQVYYGSQIKWCYATNGLLIDEDISAWADKDFVIRPYIFKQSTTAYITANYSYLNIVRGNVIS